MPITNITQTISTLPPAGRRGVDVQTVFVNKQEDFQDHLQGTTVTELNTLKDQLNTRIGEINSTTTTMNGYANTASAGASTATTKAGEASTSASDALSYKNQAETFKNNASASATKASMWADNNYNAAVEVGKYSAKHWSIVAQNATEGKVDKVTSTDNAVVRFNGVTGQVQNSGVVIDDNGNLGIGTTSPQSSLHIAKASLSSIGPELRLHNNYDSGAIGHATNIVLKTGVGTTDGKQWNIGTVSTDTFGGNPALLFKVAAQDFTIPTEKIRIDHNGYLLLTSGTGALGYGTGSGGTVTQLTSKSTAVTLNKPTGQITMNNDVLAAGASVEFSLNNSLIGASDLVIPAGDLFSYNYRIEVRSVGYGSCVFRITNITAGSRSEALIFKFGVIKGAIA